MRVSTSKSEAMLFCLKCCITPIRFRVVLLPRVMYCHLVDSSHSNGEWEDQANWFVVGSEAFERCDEEAAVTEDKTFTVLLQSIYVPILTCILSMVMSIGLWFKQWDTRKKKKKEPNWVSSKGQLGSGIERGCGAETLKGASRGGASIRLGCLLVAFLWGFFQAHPMGGDPAVTGGITYFIQPGNALGSPRSSWKLGRGTSGALCLARPLTLDKRKKMDGWMDMTAQNKVD